MSAAAVCDLDGQYKLYGEAVPILDMPMRQRGGDCKPCTQDYMNDAENPKPDGGQFDSMFGGYLSDMAKKLNATSKKPEQSGGGGGVGFSFMPENYIAGQSEVRAYGSNMDPVPRSDGGLYFPKCGEPLCVGASGQYGGSRKSSNTRLKKMRKSKRQSKRHTKKHTKSRGRKTMRKSRKCMGASCTVPNCTCPVCLKYKVKKMQMMRGGAATADFRALGSKEQPYPFDGETSVLEVNPSLAGRDFSCRQPNWGPQCI